MLLKPKIEVANEVRKSLTGPIGIARQIEIDGYILCEPRLGVPGSQLANAGILEMHDGWHEARFVLAGQHVADKIFQLLGLPPRSKAQTHVVVVPAIDIPAVGLAESDAQRGKRQSSSGRMLQFRKDRLNMIVNSLKLI